MLATNIAGNDAVARSESLELKKSSYSLRGRSRLLDPPVTFIEAQFIYISRFPTLLNQVHAKVYAPGAIPAGMLYLYVSGSAVVSGFPPSGRFPGVSLAGHPPSIEWMTNHLEFLVAGLSVVRETWQDPPPCVADPKKERICCSPIAMLVTVAPALLVALHGKLEPEASRGELSGLPYEAGEDMIMWALPVANRRATVAARVD